MRILFLTQVLPYPLDAGPKVRAYYVLRYLAGAGHELTLASFRRATDTPAALAHLGQWCAGGVHTVPMPRSRWRDLAAFGNSRLSGQPFLIARDSVGDMRALVRQLSLDSAFDAVHADQLWMAPYALAAAAAKPRPRRPLRVLDQHNAVFQVPRRLAEGAPDPLRRALLRDEARRLARYEVATCRRFDHVVWVTDEDRAAFEAARDDDADNASAAMPPFTTIPICVDPGSEPVLPRAVGARRVTFLGGMHWPPNAAGIAWFAQQVWPAVRQAVPEAVLTIIGRRPPDSLQRLAKGDPSIDITGYVEDPHRHLAETAAFIVPLFSGGGMRVKITDAWCWGLPVVTTTIGGEGVALRHGDNALVADTADTFSAAVVRVLSEPAIAHSLAAAGRQTVEQCYDWRQVYPAWDIVYTSPSAAHPSVAVPT